MNEFIQFTYANTERWGIKRRTLTSAHGETQLIDGIVAKIYQDFRSYGDDIVSYGYAAAEIAKGENGTESVPLVFNACNRAADDGRIGNGRGGEQFYLLHVNAGSALTRSGYAFSFIKSAENNFTVKGIETVLPRNGYDKNGITVQNGFEYYRLLSDGEVSDSVNKGLLNDKIFNEYNYKTLIKIACAALTQNRVYLCVNGKDDAKLIPDYIAGALRLLPYGSANKVYFNTFMPNPFQDKGLLDFKIRGVVNGYLNKNASESGDLNLAALCKCGTVFSLGGAGDKLVNEPDGLRKCPLYKLADLSFAEFRRWLDVIKTQNYLNADETAAERMAVIFLNLCGESTRLDSFFGLTDQIFAAMGGFAENVFYSFLKDADAARDFLLKLADEAGIGRDGSAEQVKVILANFLKDKAWLKNLIYGAEFVKRIKELLKVGDSFKTADIYDVRILKLTAAVFTVKAFESNEETREASDCLRETVNRFLINNSDDEYVDSLVLPDGRNGKWKFFLELISIGAFADSAKDRWIKKVCKTNPFTSVQHELLVNSNNREAVLKLLRGRYLIIESYERLKELLQTMKLLPDGKCKDFCKSQFNNHDVFTKVTANERNVFMEITDGNALDERESGWKELFAEAAYISGVSVDAYKKTIGKFIDETRRYLENVNSTKTMLTAYRGRINDGFQKEQTKLFKKKISRQQRARETSTRNKILLLCALSYLISLAFIAAFAVASYQAGCFGRWESIAISAVLAVAALTVNIVTARKNRLKDNLGEYRKEIFKACAHTVAVSFIAFVTITATLLLINFTYYK